MAQFHRRKHGVHLESTPSKESHKGIHLEQKPSKESHKKPRLSEFTGITKANLWRVIAPFVTTKKSSKLDAHVEDNTQFSFYLQKRPAVLLHDLTNCMSDSVDLSSLMHETAEVLKNVTKATGVNLYLADRATKELYHCHLGVVVSDRFKVRWKIEEGTILAAFVASRNEYVILDDIVGDKRFPEGLGYEGDTIPQSVLCLPVVTPEGECYAVIELYRRVFETPFTMDNLKICIMIAAWMGIAIQKNQERLALKRHQELNDYLLDLIRCYFGDNVLMEKLMSEVIKFAKKALGAERGSFFIVDQENNEMVAHLFDENDVAQYKRGLKVKLRGIAGLVAKTGITMNIKDAYQDSRFSKDVDLATGYITRSILCMPIIGAHGVLGVVELINKTNGGYFTSNDETLFKTFSLYCSLAMHYTNINTRIKKVEKLSSIYEDMIKLQLRPCIHDYKQFVQQPTIEIPSNFDQFSWYFNDDTEYLNSPQYCLHIILELMDVREINLKNMIKFVLSARKLYQDNPYHNFEHAFNVFHCMYVILKRNVGLFSNTEIKALTIASLCHDINHGGFTNNFLVLMKDDLAQLYQKSILENHHYQVTMMMLQTYDIYPNLTEAKRKLFHQEIEEAILATDLALYFEKRGQLIKLYNDKNLDWFNKSHRRVVKAIMMTSCDLSGQCKPFLIAKRITDNLYREFYHQGDLEKEMNLCPLSIMDRDKKYLMPEDQIQFLNVVVIPCVEVLRIVLPNTVDLYNGAIMLKQTWLEIAEARGKKVWRQDDSIIHQFFFGQHCT